MQKERLKSCSLQLTCLVTQKESFATILVGVIVEPSADLDGLIAVTVNGDGLRALPSDIIERAVSVNDRRLSQGA
jgi:hypothetical protein